MSDPETKAPADGTAPFTATPAASATGGVETAVVTAAAEPAPPAATAAPTPPPAVPAKPERPRFIEDLRTAYNLKGKGVVVLTGNTHDYFHSPRVGHFVDFEPVVYQEFGEKFSVMRLDIANGLSLFTNDDLPALQTAVNKHDGTKTEPSQKLGQIKPQLDKTRNSPLAALACLREIMEAVHRIRKPDPNKPADPTIKPICAIVQFAGALFPAGEFDKLNEADRQRLVTFLSMIETPWFKNSGHMVLLVGDTRAEMNGRIIGLPSVDCVEINLPNEGERRRYVETYIEANPNKVSFEKGADDFIAMATGLKLTSLREMLVTATQSGKAISRSDLLVAINELLQAELGDIIAIPEFDHSIKDIIGYEETGKIFLKVFKRCEKPETATAALLVSGPNGGGKTFQLQAYAKESGRVIIELKGLRGMYFGQTDVFFEKLKLILRQFGKVLILVDEAHTAFGSVHKSDTHETEKRLAGNIIKMMSDETMFGKVVWALATSRPDELDPDVKSRAPTQIPIFDLEGEERKAYIKSMLARKKIKISDEDLEKVIELTAHYSNRDLSGLLKETLDTEEKSVLATLDFWEASDAIQAPRILQTLIAGQHCTYPKLLPESIRAQRKTPAYAALIRGQKLALGYGV